MILTFLALGGCASYSQYIPSTAATAHTPAALPAPEDKILIIYNHGSQPEDRQDYCFPNGWTTPEVIKRLSGQTINGYEVVVYGHCSPWQYGGYNHVLRLGEPKVLRRAKSLEGLIQDFIDHGVPSRQIFLAGHSAGAWASLLVARRNQVRINSVIGFAPAFAGEEAKRPEGWIELRARQVTYLREAEAMPALIYAFEYDPFNGPEDLVFLRDIPGIVMLGPDESYVQQKEDCPTPTGHRAAFSRCFAETQGDRIRDYMSQRLTATTEPSPIPAQREHDPIGGS